MTLVTQRTTIGVGAIIQDDRGRVLLIKRATEPEKGKWGIPGGHVNFQESLQEAITREVKEETGLDVVDSCLFTYTESIRADKDAHYIIFYFLTRTEGTIKISQPEEIADASWHTPEQIKTMKLAFSHEKLLALFAKNDGKMTPGQCLRTVGTW